MQINVDESIGVSYADCLRAILRQDPDMILVGEIRDPETALEAIRAGLYPVLPNRLAYPELLPSELRADGRFLYDGGEDEGHEREAAASALQRALEAVAAGTSTEARQALVAGTERFLWPQIAPRFDAIFEAAGSSEIGT